MSERNFRFPSLSRDLTLIGAGIVVVSALAGAGSGVAVDVLRHRAA